MSNFSTNLRTNRGFPTRMVYLHYISCLRYAILVGNPWNAFNVMPTTWFISLIKCMSILFLCCFVLFETTIKQEFPGNDNSLHHSSSASSAFPATSLGFTTFGVRFCVCDHFSIQPKRQSHCLHGSSAIQKRNEKHMQIHGWAWTVIWDISHKTVTMICYWS